MNRFAPMAAAAAFLMFLAGAPVLAAENESVQDALKGFDGDKSASSVEKSEAKKIPYRLTGWGKLSLAYDYTQDEPPDLPPPEGTDHGGLSRVQPEIFMEFQADLTEDWKMRLGGRFRHDYVIDLKGRDHYAQQYIDDRENDLELWETFAQGRLLPALDLKIGRQIVAWGTSDDLRVTDVINPLDFREIGVTDVEGMRLPIAISRLDYTIRDWTITGLAIHEIRSDYSPVIGSPYALADQPFIPDDKPADSLDNTGFGLALQGKLPGWDISFYFADYYNHAPFVQETKPLTVYVPMTVPMPPPFPPQVMSVPVEIPQYQLAYARIKMVGAATNVALGNWLLKGEAAYKSGFEYLYLPNQTKDKVEGLLGLEYNGFTDMVISLESMVSHVLDYDDVLREYPDNLKETQFIHALRVQKDWMNDTLHLVMVGNLVGETAGEGWFARGQVQYEWTDAFSTTLGLVVYGTGDDLTFQEIDDNDQVFVQAKYTF